MMGIRCLSCGLLTNPVATVENAQFFFFQDETQATGTATYVIDVCSDNTPVGNFSVVFVDMDGGENRSFTFNSVTIETVTCTQQNGVCEVLVSGTGNVVGQLENRLFVAQFSIPEQGLETIEIFVIDGFASQASQVTVSPNESIIVIGCQQQG
jgi:hypothetical protein